MQGLDRPLQLHHPACQVFEQFRVRGTLPKHAEIVGSIDDATAEVALPNPVRYYSREQGVTHDGLSQLEPPAPAAKRNRFAIAQNRKKPAWDFLTEVLRVPADVQPQIAWMGYVRDAVNIRILRGPACVQGVGRG